MNAENLHIWNEKIYSEGNVHQNYFEERGIRSWPKYKDAFASHIPKLWEPYVSQMIDEIKRKHDDVKFLQIKEKFIELVVYYSCRIEDQEDVYGIIEKYKSILKKKGLSV